VTTIERASTRPVTASGPLRVRRAGASGPVVGAVGLAVVVVLALMPVLVSEADTTLLVNFFVLLTMAVMWNLLAGYAGMVSIGQQAFVGLGGYGVLVLAINGFDPVAAIPVAAVVCALIALPVSVLLFRLGGGYFAIATWVVADTAQLVISSFTSLGGGTGHPVPGLSSMSPHTFAETTYWAALAVAVVSLGLAYGLLRSPLGLLMAAVRDDEVSARSAGARVMTTRRIVYVVAALGCGAAGAILAVSQLQVQPSSIFSIQWAAEMIFVSMIGGMGTLEGPILGTIIFFVLQQNLAQEGAWYLIIFGAVAVVVAIWTPRGLWGAVRQRTGIELFPVGYRLRGGARNQGTDSQLLEDDTVPDSNGSAARLGALWRRLRP
jgi:ABC-type branched-subunit amino acid transport system permease subunit